MRSRRAQIASSAVPLGDMKGTASSLLFLLVVGVIVGVALAIYTPGEETVKPAQRREHLQWPTAAPSPTPTPTPTPGPGSRRFVGRVTGLCPTGVDAPKSQLLPLAGDCRRFVSCWRGRAFVQACAPGTLFNAATRECDHPAKVKCMQDHGAEHGYSGDRVPAVPTPRSTQSPRPTPPAPPSTRLQPPSAPRPVPPSDDLVQTRHGKSAPPATDLRPPERRYLFEPPSRHLVPPLLPPPPPHLLPPQVATSRPPPPPPPLPCSMPGGTGLEPHPTDCARYLNCWRGTPHVQTCAAGTRFSARTSRCEHAREVVCSTGSARQRPASVGPVWPTPVSTRPPWSPTRPGWQPIWDTTTAARQSPVPTRPSPLPPWQVPNQSPSSFPPPPSLPTFSRYPPAPSYNPSASLSPPPSSNTGVSQHRPYVPFPPPQPPTPAPHPHPTKFNDPHDTLLSNHRPRIPDEWGDVMSRPGTAVRAVNDSVRVDDGVRVNGGVQHSAPWNRTTPEDRVVTRTSVWPTSPSTTPTSRTTQTPKTTPSTPSTTPAVEIRPTEPPPTLPPPTALPWTQAVDKKTSDEPVVPTSPGEAEEKSSTATDHQRGGKIVNSGVQDSGLALRLRGGRDPSEGFVWARDPSAGWGLTCDEPGQWTLAEAHVACRQLGYPRGAALSWQGSVAWPPPTNARAAFTSVRCHGHEQALSSCAVHTTGVCAAARDACAIRCQQDARDHCARSGERAHAGKCLRVVRPDAVAALGAFSRAEALEDCRSGGGQLLDITTSAQHHFVTEWLAQAAPEVELVLTSGVGVPVLGRLVWLWESSGEPFPFHAWGAGWREATLAQGSRTRCLVLRREANEFVWAAQDCAEAKGAPYVCQRPYDEIACDESNAHACREPEVHSMTDLETGPMEPESGIGPEAIVEPETVIKPETSGNIVYVTDRETRPVEKCELFFKPETSPDLEWMKERESKNESNDVRREQHLPPTAPTTQRTTPTPPQVAQQATAQTFARPIAARRPGVPNPAQRAAAPIACGPQEFRCSPRMCVPSKWRCDGHADCPDGRDEPDCAPVALPRFEVRTGRRLEGHDAQKWLGSRAESCARRCLESKDIKCLSFSHHPVDETCLLSAANVGTTGALVVAERWNYYELKSASVDCTHLFRCDNEKCVNKTAVCDGKNDCGDRSDESECSALYKDYEIRLAGSNVSHEGRIEIKVGGRWGLVCDDLFDLRDAEVACRELGFPLGARELIAGVAAPDAERGLVFLVDDLQCRGDETTLRDCDFDGWGVHDCSPDEVAGMACRVAGLECSADQWRCETSLECVSVTFLCDGIEDCDDSSDEADRHCKAPIALRLADGPTNSSGRVEVRRHGVWGTVCDDDFDKRAAKVICKSLGFPGDAQALKGAPFGAGSGHIWLDQLACAGTEDAVELCRHAPWGDHNCAHDEDAAVVCEAKELPVQQATASRLQKATPAVAVSILPAVCGLQPFESPPTPSSGQPRVVGGSEVSPGSQPWVASLRVRSAGKSVHWCGAVVIAPQFVLTAGHCLQDYRKAAYIVRAGDHDTEVLESGEQEAHVADIFAHAQFNAGLRMANDIAVVKLKGAGFRLGKSVQPICLPQPAVESTHASRGDCTTSGWGSARAAGSGYSRTLRTARVPLLPDATCRSEHVYGAAAAGEGMICAGHLEGGADACQGDSGGPLVCVDEGRYTLHGITSWGHGCGRSNKPGVYTRVAFYRKWIDQQVADAVRVS